MNLIIWLAVAALWPWPAHADPISISILAVVGIEATAGTAIVAVTTFALTTAAAIGLNYLASKFGAQPSDGTPTDNNAAQGVNTSVTIGGAVPRSAIFGKFSTAGHLIYWNTYGTDNTGLQLVFAIGDGLHDALTGIFVNGHACTFGTPEATGTPINEFRAVDGTARLWVTFHNGSETQAVDGNLVAVANPAGRWSSANTLAGIAYVVVTAIYQPEIFPNGIPQLLFVVNGLRCYDPRKDSTNGGVGPHRWGTPSTYEFSDNVAVCLYNYQRGLFLNGALVLGQGLATLDLITDMYVAAANVCDEAIPLKAGGTEPAYRVGMEVSADTEYRTVIQSFLTAMAGTLTESAGAFGPIAGASNVVALPTITDRDLIVGKPVRYAAKRSRSELINGVFGRYTEPAQSWQMVAFPPRTSSADEITDGERLAVQRDYPMISSQTQAQRVGEIERELGRFQATATIVLGFKFVVLEPGDWITWQSTRFNFTKTFQVVTASKAPDETITLALREIAASVFGWNPAVQELSPLVPGDLPGIGTQLSTVSGFALQAIQIAGAAGLTIPALRAVWSPISDHTITSVVIQYRVQGSTALKQVACDEPSNGEYIISEGIQASTIYEARATIETDPARVTTFTSFVTQTAPPLHVVPTAQNLDPTAGLSDLVRNFARDAAATLNTIAQNIANAAAEQDAGNWTDKKQVRQDIQSASGALSAAISTVSQAASNAQSAVASLSSTVTAGFSDTNASVATNATAIANLSGKFAAQWTVTLDVNGFVSGIKSFNDGTTAGTVFIGSIFQVAFPGVAGGAPVPIFTIGVVNGQARIALAADIYADAAITSRSIATGAVLANSISAGAVTAGKIAAGAINATNIVANNVIVTSHLQADTATALFFAKGSGSPGGQALFDAVSVGSTTFGGSLAIDVSVAVVSTDSTNLQSAEGTLSILQDGSVIHTCPIYQTMIVLGNGTFLSRMRGVFATSFVALGIAPGFHTFTLRVECPASSTQSWLTVTAPVIKTFESMR